jgi:hypothetical protein
MATSANTPLNSPNNPATGTTKASGNELSTKPVQANGANPASKKSARLEIVRKDIAVIEVVDTDFVITTKSGRKILIRDGALNAVTDEEFSVTFADDEVASGKALFSESQTSLVEPTQLKWSDAELPDASGLVAPAAVSTGFSGLGAVAVAVAAAAAGGKSGSSATPDNAALAAAALKSIGDFAKANTDSQPTASGNYIGTPPDLKAFETAGVKGVTVFNIASIHDALATAAVTDVSVNTLAKLQALVDAYNIIITLANGQVDAGGIFPNADQYTLLGLTGLDSQITLLPQKIKLLNAVIDLKTQRDIDTVKEIQSLIAVVTQVMEAAAGGTGLTQSQLELLGLSGLTPENFALVLKAINDSPDNGSGVDSLDALQKIVTDIVNTTGARNALQTIVDFAETNGATAVPRAVTYQTAGVLKLNGIAVSEADAVSYNSALMTTSVIGNSVNALSKLQNLVDAYQKVFTLADGTANAITGSGASTDQYLTLTDLKLLGADTSKFEGVVTAESRRILLNGILDRQLPGGVNTVPKINDLIKITNAIQDQVGNVVNVKNLKAADFAAIGVQGVTDGNLDAFIQGLQKISPDKANSISALQNLLYSNLSLTFTAISQDTGASTSDFLTTETVLDFRGKSNAADGTKIRVTLSHPNLTDITMNGVVTAGEWIVNSANSSTNVLSQGIYKVSANLYDGNDNAIRSAKFDQSVTIDTYADYLPDGQPDLNLSGKTISFTDISPDTGVQKDFKTSIRNLIFSGTSTAAVDTNFGVRIDNGAVHYQKITAGTSANGLNVWEFNNTKQELSTGKHTVEVFLTDEAGNRLSGGGQSQEIFIDTTGLTLVDKTTGAIAASANLVLTFNTGVKAVDSLHFITITNEKTGISQSMRPGLAQRLRSIRVMT